MKTKIYVLTEPDGEIRYIGKTVKSLSRRLIQHLSDAKHGVKNYRCNWIYSILEKGYLPKIQLVGEVEGNGYQEEIAWIDYGWSQNWRLVNLTTGGEGSPGHKQPFSETQRRRTSEANKGNHYCLGYKHSEETRHKMSVAKMGHSVSPITRQKLSITHKGKTPWKGLHHSEETKRKMSETKKGHKVSEETRRKIGLANKGQLLGRKFSKEHKRKISEGKKAGYAKRRTDGQNKV